MADRPDRYEERKRHRSVRYDKDKVYFHQVEELKRLFPDERGIPHTEADTQSQLSFLCDFCSTSIPVDNLLQYDNHVYHRLPCGLEVIDEALDQIVENPASYPPSVVIRTRALWNQLSREARPSLLQRIFPFLFGRRS